jgi:AraC-like DNA-binding protein
MVNPTVSLRSVQNILRAAEAAGHAAPELLAASGIVLPSEEDPDLRVPADAYHRLWAIAMERVGDPALPLRVAEQLDATSYDVFGFSIITSANVGDALRRVQRYLPVITDAVRAALTVEGEFARFSFIRDDPRPEQCHADEFMLATTVGMLRRHTGLRFCPLEVRYPHAKPADVSSQKLFYGSPLRFGRPCAELYFGAASLDVPLQRADSGMARFFDRYIQALLERMVPERSLVRTLKQAMIDGLSSGDCSLETAAKSLGMGARTLRRRLQEEKVSFRAVLDEVRCELARRHLEEHRLTLAEIAFVLGYSDVTPFHRAFRRWTGTTPDDYRSHRAGSLFRPKS